MNESFQSLKKGDMEIYGQFDENNNINGYGTVRRYGSIIYEGEFIDSKRNGFGIEYIDGRMIFQGTFLNDLRDSWGKCN
jgi:hypothetical protein